MNKLVHISVVIVALLAFLPFNLAISATTNSPVGTWTSIDDETNKPRSIIRVTERNGVIYGRILKVLNKQPDDTGICDNCPGDFRGKKIQGLQIMWGLKQSGQNVWSGGRILDPKKGKIYRVKITLSPNGRRLDVRGYIGFSLLGRTQVWHRR